MKKFFIKVIGKTFFDVYPVKAENLFFAKMLAFNKFRTEYACENNTTNIKMQRVDITGTII